MPLMEINSELALDLEIKAISLGKRFSIIDRVQISKLETWNREDNTEQSGNARL